ncbi:MAG TPA: right-handed parallel beta-helix repeat-containing protein [Methylomirabilota bacterium]
MLTLICGLLLASSARAAQITPGSDLCAAINALQPGEELALAPGDYTGPCTIHRGGRPGSPIVIRALDPGQRPRIAYPGASANVLDVKADHVTIRGLAFGPTASGVDGVRVFARAGVSVMDCEFDGLGGIAIAANHVSTRGLSVLRNVITNSGSTGMYFGCHQGVECVVSALRVEDNFIGHINAADPEIGYGVQVKLNSTGIIRNNVIVDTKGPGIMVYGARDGLSSMVVERNVVMGSRTSSGIVIGGGPATVRNNVVLLNRDAGIGLEDYGGRGLLRAIVVAHNTVYKNTGAGILVPEERPLRDIVIRSNAVQARAGTAALPAPRSGIDLMGNVDCTWAPCFVDPDRLDFSPLTGSLLSVPGSMRPGPWLPPDDLFGVPRGPLPTVGAVERRARPIRVTP